MPAIADQVAALELDHAGALAQIDSLKATLSALTASHAAVTADNAALEAKVAELSTRTDGMIAMAEKVASSALDMLTAARLPAGTPAEVIPFAPKLKTLTTASVAPSVVLADVPEPARQAEAIASETVPRAAPSWPPKPAAVPIIEPMSAVDRIKRHFLPAVTLMRRPVDSAMRVDPGGLPMFLRRDTVFARTVDAA